MTKSAHTPTPWQVVKNSMGDPVKIFAPYSLGHVCNCDVRGGDLATREANAAHIVHCVNTHDALVAALRGLIAQHDRPHGFADEHWYARELEQARAALAAAEGKA